MKLLDEKGLTTVWAAIKGKFINKSDADEKYANKTELQGIKGWTLLNFLSLNGGSIYGDTSFAGDIMVRDNISINGNVFTHYNVSANHFIINEGTPTLALIADGSVKEIGSANGIAGLDSNGYVPLAQLGNLDTTVAEVVTELPTTDIKKHIYLIRDNNGVTQNQYLEYIYTGDTSADYDSSKWEKLGECSIDVDLSKYDMAIKRPGINHSPDHVLLYYFNFKNDTTSAYSVKLKPASHSAAGVMITDDKIKLDGVADNATADSAIAIEEIDALN